MMLSQYLIRFIKQNDMRQNLNQIIRDCHIQPPLVIHQGYINKIKLHRCIEINVSLHWVFEKLSGSK